MNRQDLYRAFQQIDDDILQRSEDAAALKTVPVRRRLGIVLLAALLSVFLLGAGVMSGLFGDSIQNWFAHYWEEITGQAMSKQHAALIQSMSQKIGLRETINGTTVTVDSATVGENSFFVLLRVEGLQFSKRYAYGFHDTRVELSSESTGESGMFAGYSFSFVGIDTDGAVLLLLDYDYITKDAPKENLLPLEVTLTLTDFAQDPRTNKCVMLAEGQWNFCFTLDRNQLESIRLPDTQVMAVDQSKREEYTEVAVVLTNMELTNTGMCFRYDTRNNELHVPAFISVILKDGKQIGINSCSGIMLTGGIMAYSCSWRIPVALEEVVAIRIGKTLIQVPQQ